MPTDVDDNIMRRYIDAQIEGIHNHIERQFISQRQQVTDGLATMEARIDGFYATRELIMSSLQVNMDKRDEVFRTRVEELQRYIDKVLGEKDRSIDMATSELDRHLHEHIQTQVEQIRTALHSAELLESKRVEQLMTVIMGVRRELEAGAQASKEAVTKSEHAIDKRLEGMNEFRAQLSDQSASFLPRETFDSTMNGWDLWRQSVDRSLSINSGENSGRREIQSSLRANLTIAVSVIAVMVAIASAIVINHH